ncbi:uncharacterized protein H6S33_005015 [Morchella sextelata]|uniref:uncharacterized protein n=1 Tax=Morchella sextelata TaxID=1174677 RepID=UPI001D053DC9|nr:uncharacterized protein H6S33_005015 [Morchella sextelata]KAH0605033.1 hypothetical protein H6S33_005015 [Morchella sextelata]
MLMDTTWNRSRFDMQTLAGIRKNIHRTSFSSAVMHDVDITSSPNLLAKRGHIMPIYMKIVHRWGISPSVAVFHHRAA